MKNFALIGAAGYIAPRHMKAIKDSGNKVVAAVDPSDSVGILDSYFPNADFFTEFERFDRYIDKRRRAGEIEPVDYVSICSPNYLHDSHIRFGLRSQANVICEKPLVLNPWNIDSLLDLEKESGNKVNTILQLRYLPNILDLKESITDLNDKKYEVDLTYITSRGNWYLRSWKGNEEKSGGISTNIGVHFFDMLSFLFGNVQENILHYKSQTKEAGYIEFDNARVRWFLSIDFNDLSLVNKAPEDITHRSIICNKEELEFSSSFNDLHSVCYESILKGQGYGLEDSKQAIEIVSDIRNKEPIGPKGEYHPLLKEFIK